MSYKYIREGLDKKVNYSYAAYGGEDFFSEYYSSREARAEAIAVRLKDLLADNLRGAGLFTGVEFAVFSDILKPMEGLSWLSDETLRGIMSTGGLRKETEGHGRLLGQYLAYIKGLAIGRLGAGGPLTTVMVEAEGGFASEEILKLIVLDSTRKLALEVVEADEIVASLASKYEVFGRIFSSYLTAKGKRGYKKNFDDFSSLTPYALMAVLLALRYEKTGDLRPLNTLCKINDLLAGVDLSVLDALQTLLIYKSISSELSFVRSLREKEREVK